MQWIGIDYGARLAGTTSVAWESKNSVQVVTVEKGKDADAWLDDWVQQLQPDFIYMDAPLSLPAAYHGKGQDYFYRQCDRELQAMSPMFLGGLTARAMRLAHQWRLNNKQVFEAYPKGLVQHIHHALMSTYKSSKEISFFFHSLSDYYAVEFPQNIRTWHEADAILAWCTGWRMQTENHSCFGNQEEGLIYL